MYLLQVRQMQMKCRNKLCVSACKLFDINTKNKIAVCVTDMCNEVCCSVCTLKMFTFFLLMRILFGF